VLADAGGRQCVFGHFALAQSEVVGTTAPQPVGFTGGNERNPA
jgi:hypothetical protein